MYTWCEYRAIHPDFFKQCSDSKCSIFSCANFISCRILLCVYHFFQFLYNLLTVTAHHSTSQLLPFDNTHLQRSFALNHKTFFEVIFYYFWILIEVKSSLLSYTLIVIVVFEYDIVMITDIYTNEPDSIHIFNISITYCKSYLDSLDLWIMFNTAVYIIYYVSRGVLSRTHWVGYLCMAN